MAVPEWVWEARFHSLCSEDIEPGCHLAKEGIHLSECSGI